MALKRYNVTVNDRRSTQTVLQLSDEDAKRAGLTDKDLWTPEGAEPAAKAAPRRTNKARTSRNKAAAKPAQKAPAQPPVVEPKPAADDASDPGASE